MKSFKMTTHALDRLTQEFGGRPKIGPIIEHIRTVPIKDEQGSLYIPFMKGVFAVVVDNGVHTLVTYIGKSRLSHGKAKRAA